MNAYQFDDITRKFATNRSRRQVLQAFLIAALFSRPTYNVISSTISAKGPRAFSKSDGFCQSTFEFAGTCDELVQYASTLPKFCPDGTALSEPGLGCTVPNFSILASPDFTFTTPLVF